MGIRGEEEQEEHLSPGKKKLISLIEYVTSLQTRTF